MSLPTSPYIPPTLPMTEIWAMGIPDNSQNKDLAWDFIRYMSSPDTARRAALNGNGPIRPSAYDDPGVQVRLPYWEAEASAISMETGYPYNVDFNGASLLARPRPRGWFRLQRLSPPA